MAVPEPRMTGDDDAAGGGPFAPLAAVDPPAGDKPKRKRLTRPELRAKKEAEAAAGGTLPAPAEPKTAERRPKVRSEKTRAPATGRRAPIADAIAGIYGGVGNVLSSIPSPLMPAGRAMALNAPVVGAAADEALAGSFIDKRLQPLAKRGDKLKALGDAAMLPVIVAMISARPELYPALAPFGRSILAANIEALGPQLVKQRQKEAALQTTIDQLVEADVLPPNHDGSAPSVDDLFAMLFALPEGMTPPPGDIPGG